MNVEQATNIIAATLYYEGRKQNKEYVVCSDGIKKVTIYVQKLQPVVTIDLDEWNKVPEIPEEMYHFILGKVKND